MTMALALVLALVLASVGRRHTWRRWDRFRLEAVRCRIFVTLDVPGRRRQCIAGGKSRAAGAGNMMRGGRGMVASTTGARIWPPCAVAHVQRACVTSVSTAPHDACGCARVECPASTARLGPS